MFSKFRNWLELDPLWMRIQSIIIKFFWRYIRIIIDKIFRYKLNPEQRIIYF